LKYTPVELGSANLMPADPLLQHINALYGTLVIEPQGSTWKCDSSTDPANINSYRGNVACDPSDVGYAGPPATRAAATVTAKGASFRDFVVAMADDLQISQNNNSAVNYRSDPTFYRYGNPEPGTFSASGDNNCAISNALVNRDPVTPVFGAEAGVHARFRLLHPSGTGAAQVFSLSGHVWQREPYINNSLSIGNNKESQWMGSHDSYGSTDHFDVVVAKAGGAESKPGDYLYSLFVPNQTGMGPAYGLWGVFRVARIVNGKPEIQPLVPPGAVKQCQEDGAKPEKAQPKPPDNAERFTRRPLKPGSN